MGGRFAAAGGTAVCLLPIMSFRSLAAARSLLLLDSSCGAVPIAPCRAICLGCLIARFLGRPFFLLKRFNEFDVPVSRSSSSRHLWQCCLLTALRFVLRLASRLVRSSRSPLSDVIDALPDRSPCRSVCGHQSPRPACRMAVSGTERGAFIVIVRPHCRCCLLALAWERLRLFRLRRSACSVGGSVCAGIVMA